MISVKKLFKNIPYRLINIRPGFQIKGISSDSRTIKNGELFIAVNGHECDGHDYIGDAIEKGAAAICSEKIARVFKEGKYIIVRDTTKILPLLASRFFGAPSKHLKLIGITGTNGKTTTSYLVYEILKTAKKSPSLLGSVQYRIRDAVLNSCNTTPGPISFHSLLNQMRNCGTHYAVMEVSSHALKQSRVSGVDFKIAAVTNITGDHLDYHRTMSDYVKSKRLLFESLKRNNIAVLNRDDKFYNELRENIKSRIISYGIKKDADFRAAHIESDISGSRFLIDTPSETIKMRTHLIGLHNVYNILAATAIAFAARIEFNAAIEAIGRFNQVPGRLELVEAGQRFKVFIDYAHTHDALKNILSELKKLSSGKLVVVFGCGGNRDKTKRPRMGKIASNIADYVILTNDNPREEDPDIILNEIEEGFSHGFRAYKRIPDRYKAIEQSLMDRNASDVVVIAGKGHEGCQIIGGQKLVFNDKTVVKEILSRMQSFAEAESALTPLAGGKR